MALKSSQLILFSLTSMHFNMNFNEPLSSGVIPKTVEKKRATSFVSKNILSLSLSMSCHIDLTYCSMSAIVTSVGSLPVRQITLLVNNSLTASRLKIYINSDKVILFVAHCSSVLNFSGLIALKTYLTNFSSEQRPNPIKGSRRSYRDKQPWSLTSMFLKNSLANSKFFILSLILCSLYLWLFNHFYYPLRFKNY